MSNYDEANAKIQVIGVGGAGGAVIHHMIEASLEGVHFLYADTDAKALANSQASVKIQLGEKLTKGFGTDSNPKIGREAAEESMRRIKESIAGADMLFIVAGMGGGTGTGATPSIAQAAKELGIFTVGVVSKPFAFEGEQRMQTAEMGIANPIFGLGKHVDSLIVIPNEGLCTMENKDAKPCDLFKQADEMLYLSVRSISDIILFQGYIAVDLADIRTAMLESGLARMGIGQATGEGRANEAAMRAMTSPLLEGSLASAKALLINITATEESLGIDEYAAVSDYIKLALCYAKNNSKGTITSRFTSQSSDGKEISSMNLDASMDEELCIRFVNGCILDVIRSAKNEGVSTLVSTISDPNMGDALRVTVIVTGIDTDEPPRQYKQFEEIKPTFIRKSIN